MKRQISFIAAIICSTVLAAQLPYTNAIYAVRKDSAVIYGVATNYCGRPDTLKMNIYKPVDNTDPLRPVIIFVHGGGFVSSENFNEFHMNAMAIQFAKRGYVAASIDYREGVHLYPYGTGAPGPNNLLATAAVDWNGIAAAYATDQAEVLRAVFRAQQDLKAAIRFMKQNHLADSTSTCHVFTAGHSAGAITVLSAAFTDLPAEKPAQAGSNTTVANPAWVSGGFNLFGNWIITQINGPQDKDNRAYRIQNPAPFNYDAPACFLRPDLGATEGDQNIAAGYNSDIIGTAALAGAVIDTNLFTGPRHPGLFLYHIPNDMIVPFNSNYPFTFWSDILTPAPYSNWPVFYGSNWIRAKLQATGYPGPYKLQLFDNGGNITNSHDILPSDMVVADSIARFFAKILDTSTACGTAMPTVMNADIQSQQPAGFRIYPNPTTGFIYISLPTAYTGEPLLFTLINSQGQQVLSRRFSGQGMQGLDIGLVGKGLYQVVISGPAEVRKLTASLSVL